MQLWGETDGSYYTANWGYNTITKIAGTGNSTKLWSYNIGTYAGGVTADSSYVYAMAHGQATVHVLNKQTGVLVNTLTLHGGGSPASALYGGLAVIDHYLVRGRGGDGIIEYYDLNQAGLYMGSYSTGYVIYGMAFDGENIYTHQNGSTSRVYQIANPIPEANCLVMLVLGLATMFYIKRS